MEDDLCHVDNSIAQSLLYQVPFLNILNFYCGFSWMTVLKSVSCQGKNNAKVYQFLIQKLIQFV